MNLHLTAQPLRDMTGLFNELLAALSTLHGLGNLKIGQSDEEGILRQALLELIQHYGMEHCAVFLPEENHLVNVATLDWLTCCGGGQTSTARALTEAEERRLYRALQTAEVQFGPEEADDVDAPARGGFPVGSSMVIPLCSGTDVIAVLHLSHPESNYFGEWQQRILRLFGVLLGQALIASRMLLKLDQEVQSRTLYLQNILEESRQLEQHYKRLSMQDELTGLHNRRYFFSESILALNLACRHRHPFTLMIMDLDRFKKVNDTYGHPSGDRVLQSMGKALREELRKTDILARVGGEEFAVALPETNGEGALEMAGRLLMKVRKLRWADIDNHLSVSLSIGMISIGPDQLHHVQAQTDLPRLFEQMLARADEGTYIAKEAGGDRVVQMTWPPMA